MVMITPLACHLSPDRASLAHLDLRVHGKCSPIAADEVVRYLVWHSSWQAEAVGIQIEVGMSRSQPNSPARSDRRLSPARTSGCFLVVSRYARIAFAPSHSLPTTSAAGSALASPAD